MAWESIVQVGVPRKCPGCPQQRMWGGFEIIDPFLNWQQKQPILSYAQYDIIQIQYRCFPCSEVSLTLVLRVEVGGLNLYCLSGCCSSTRLVMMIIILIKMTKFWKKWKFWKGDNHHYRSIQKMQHWCRGWWHTQKRRSNKAKRFSTAYLKLMTYVCVN